MDFENLISIIVESEYTPRIIWNSFRMGSKLLYIYIKKKLEKQPNQTKIQNKPIDQKRKKKKKRKRKKPNN